MNWNNRQWNNDLAWRRDFARAEVRAIMRRMREDREREMRFLLTFAVGQEWDEVKKCQEGRAEGRKPQFLFRPEWLAPADTGPVVGNQWAPDPQTRGLFAQVAASVARAWARPTRRTGRSKG